MTHLGRNGAFNTTQLLDGTVEIISVADHDAHDELQLGLHTDLKFKLGNYITASLNFASW